MKDFSKPKNISVNPKTSKMLNLKSLRETLKTGTIDKINKGNISIVSNTSSIKQNKNEQKFSPNIYYNKDIFQYNMNKKSDLEKLKSKTIGGSVTKDKNMRKSNKIKKRESESKKSIFDVLQPNEPAGKN